MPMQTQRRGEGIAPNHLQPNTTRRWVISATLWPFNPLEKPSTCCTGGWMAWKILPPLEFYPRMVQPLLSCHTECTIPAPPVQGD